ncbi:hypothetical protein C0991_012380 [Blastosporella zonata]|nr:hypothetical protein C0991_012380 [Blastosporella zonata]
MSREYVPFFENTTLPAVQKTRTRQVNVGIASSSAHAGPSTPFDVQVAKIRSEAEICQQFVDDFVNSNISQREFIKKLREIDMTAEQARDFIQQADQLIQIRDAKERRLRTPTPEPITTPAAPVDTDVADRSQTLESEEPPAKTQNDEWDNFEAKYLFASRRDDTSSFLDKLVELFDEDRQYKHPSGIPDSVLRIAPHLAEREHPKPMDPHIQRTHELKRAYSSEKALESLLDFARSQAVRDPVSRGIWKLIILDQFVDFAKLYATFEPTYPKDFDHDFVLINKDQINQRRPILDEADWTRCFDAWSEGVCIFYPHRQEELQIYKGEVVDMYRKGSHYVSIAIDFDIDARSRYANQPFRLDDAVKISKIYTDHVIKSIQAPKRPPTTQSGFTSRKKRTTICQNWNFGMCDDETCPRKHGICNECRDHHRARDVPDCFKKLKARRRRIYSGIGRGEKS